MTGISIAKDTYDRYQSGNTFGESITISTYSNVLGFAAATLTGAVLAGGVALTGSAAVLVVGAAVLTGLLVSKSVDWLYDNVGIVKDAMDNIGKQIDETIKFVQDSVNFIINMFK